MKLDEFTLAYIDCMLWSTNDESDPTGGEPLDENYDVDDIDHDSLLRIVGDCQEFQMIHAGDINGNCIAVRELPWTDLEMAGYDFWLTRNGHGEGFWDEDWEESAGQRMDKTSKEYGEVNPYVSDGKIHLSS